MLNRVRQAFRHRRDTASDRSNQTNNACSIKNNTNDNRAELSKLFYNSVDIKYREFEIGNQNPIQCFICYTEGLVNKDDINLFIMEPLLSSNSTNKIDQMSSSSVFSLIKNQTLTSTSVTEVVNLDDAISGILSGKTALFVNGENTALLVSTEGFAARKVEEPDTESTVRGSREGFNEVLNVNTSLIRRKISNPNLTFEEMTIGKQTQTKVRIGYISGIANPKVVEEVKKRLNEIDTDTILESGYIEQFIEDNPYSIFPTIGNSEKSDKVAGKILEGRVAIFCNGTPFVLTVPHLLIEIFQVPEDYYSRPFLVSIMRLFRLAAFFLTLITPAFFVAIATYHHEMVPAFLLVTMAAAEEKVPFPVFLEAIMMIVIFEILREAGVRMPRPIGSAISIVGALVIGEATVQAGLISAPMVIVVALTAITGFVVSAINDAIIIIRFFLLILAGTLGFYGLLMGLLVIIGHLCSLRSFGSPFLAPFGPVILSEWKDAFIRMPLKSLTFRPQTITWKRSRRQGFKNPLRPPKYNKKD
ncbi:spore germination protein [Gracilibacillus caseinilyticus]|uniref:Spore germination protein n=1 Tax=Gracilibacillus caseinilyticus TaxID=2932256 RepID=A0ABY4EY61_9BACI|nr:spore germination protein [Gracilibacillus caseinilyticus]UOQ49341.1 spore germination protein [Gracilibacillus caseinilyticus]